VTRRAGEGGFLRPVFVALSLLAVLAAVPAASASGLVGRWRITAVAGVDALDAARTRAEFAANGRFASTVGCNRLATSATVSGAKLTFSPVIATRMACPGALGEIEHAYGAALEGVRGYSLAGATLTLRGEDGSALVTLERVK
jgi:heat shock protein HslJ